MARDSADVVNIASLQQELVALKGDLKITKQFRENGLQRLHDLRIENKRLKLQLGKVKAQEELALKIESLRKQIEAKENEKHETVLKQMIAVVFSEEADDPVISEDDRSYPSTLERCISSRTLRPSCSDYALNLAKNSLFMPDEDEDDSTFLLGESGSVFDDSTRWSDKSASDLKEIISLDEESKTYSEESSDESLEAYLGHISDEKDFKESALLEESSDSEESSETVEIHHFCQIDENGVSSFSVLRENIGQLNEQGQDSAAGLEGGVESKGRLSIRRLILHTKKIIRRPSHRKNNIHVA